MRSTTKIRVWRAAVAAAWALACAFAAGAAGPAPATASAVPAPPPIALSAQGSNIPLDQRSRYWIDNAGTLTPSQIEERSATLPWALREAGGTYNLDGGKALWIEFDAIHSAPQRWFVELQSSGIDRAQLFYRNANGDWVEQEAGDTKAVSQWPLPGRFPTFELAPPGAQAVRYWLRMEHARVDFASPIALHDQSTLVASREREQFLLGGYFGLALLIAFVATANAIVYRDRNFGVYAVYVVALAAGQLAYLGIGAQHIWDRLLAWNEVATFVLPGMSAAAALWFARTVTEPARFSRTLDLAVWGLIFALLCAVAFDTYTLSRASFAIVLVLILAALAVVALLVGLVWTRGHDPTIRLIALGFLPVLLMALLPVARGLNLIPASAFTRYALSIGAAIEMPVLFYALTVRGNRRRESHVRAAALSHNDTLTGLAHIRTLMQRLEGAVERARNLKHACALLAVRISNYDAIVAECGRDTGERVLVVTASQLRNAITDIDLAARVGDHDFALLLEGPTTTENATSRAQQIVASGLRASNALPAGTTIKYHITVAMLPEDKLDAAGSLRWLVEGLNSMRPDARKLIKPLNF